MNKLGAGILGFLGGVAATAVAGYLALNITHSSKSDLGTLVRENASRPKPAITRTMKPDPKKSLVEELMAETEKSAVPAAPTGLENKIGFEYTAVFTGTGAKFITGYQITEFLYQVKENDSGSAQEVLDVHYDYYSTGFLDKQFSVFFDKDLVVTKITSGGILSGNTPGSSTISFDRKTGSVSYPQSLNEEQAKMKLKKARILVRQFKDITGVDDYVNEWDGHSKISVKTYTIEEQAQSSTE